MSINALNVLSSFTQQTFSGENKQSQFRHQALECDSLPSQKLYFNKFRSVLELNENNRLDALDESSMWFAGFLNQLADAEVTLDDLNRLRDTCSNPTMGNEKWTDLWFANSDNTHLYPTNYEVEKHNQSVLNNLKNPIVQIDAKNSSAKMRKLSTDRCGQLFNVIFLASEAKVTLTFNLYPEIGLANGSTGKVVNIKYLDDESLQNKNILC